MCFLYKVLQVLIFGLNIKFIFSKVYFFFMNFEFSIVFIFLNGGESLFFKFLYKGCNL